MSAPLHPASVDDHSTLLALIAEYFAYDEIPFEPESVAKGLDQLLLDPSLGRTFLIKSGSEVAGYLILTFGFDLEVGGRLGLLTDLYLRPAWRRQGLGSRALEALFDQSRALGLHAIELQAERDNSEARAFYAKMGFAAFDRIPLCKRLSPPGISR